MRDASVGHQCPECVREGRRTQRPVRTAFGGSTIGQRGYVTYTLIVASVLMLLGTIISAGAADVLAGGGGWGGLMGAISPLHLWGGVIGDGFYGNPPALHGIAEGEYYRLFTAMFLHFGLLHLLLNMWALWLLGPFLERDLGPARFLALYLSAGLGGDVAAYLFSRPAAITAGASGAIFGLFAAYFILQRKLGRDASGLVPVLVLNVVFTFGGHNISIAGHVGGFIVGAAVAAGMAYAPRARRTLFQGGAVAAVLVVLALLTAVRTSTLVG